MIRHALSILATTAISCLALAQDLPKASPLARVEQVIGLTKVSVDYSRPGVKGRAVFGSLVPYGEVWRTGANHCTTITFDSSVRLEGMDIPAGKYALFTLPNHDTWVVMLNKNAEQWGATEYDAALDIISMKVPASACDLTETFTIEFTDVQIDQAVLELRWETTKVRFKIGSDPMPKALANIDLALKKEPVTPDVLDASASFYIEHGLKPEAALEWAKRSVAAEPKYWRIFTMAEAYAASGQNTEASKFAHQAIDQANKEGDKSSAKSYVEKMARWGVK